VEACDGEDGCAAEVVKRSRVVRERGAEPKGGGAGGVTESIEAPQHEDGDYGDGREGSSKAKGKFGAGGFWGAEDLPGYEEQEHGSQEDAGVLGGEKEAGGDAGEEKAEKRWVCYVTIEGVDGEQKEERNTDVRGDERGVGEEVGVEDYEEQGEEAGTGAEPLLPGEKDDEREGQCEQTSAESHAEDEVLGGTVVAGEEVAAVEIGFGLEVTALQGRGPEVSAYERERGEKFDERRMLGVETVVGGLVHHVAGEDMVVFVEGERFAMDDEGHEQSLNDKKGKDCCPCPSR
jgi:hypothetical protein